DAVWSVGSGGAACFTNGDASIFGASAGLPAAGGTSIAVDDAGYIWITTTDNGLYRSTAAPRGSDIASTRFAPVWTTANGAPSNSMRSLLWQDQKLWVGTSGGLAVVQTEPFRVLS